MSRTAIASNTPNCGIFWCSEERKSWKQGHERALAAQKDESEAALKRHLDLIDRLLADKDSLARQVDDAKEKLGNLEAKHADTVSALKAGWAQELKKQKDGWTAAEKVTVRTR